MLPKQITSGNSPSTAQTSGSETTLPESSFFVLIEPHIIRQKPGSLAKEKFGSRLAAHYGVYVMNFGESSDPRVLVELAVKAEQSGWDGFSLTDAIMYHADGHEPATDTFTALAAIVRLDSETSPRTVPHRVFDVPVESEGRKCDTLEESV